MQQQRFLLAAALFLSATAEVAAGQASAPDPLALALACAGCHGTGVGSPGAAPKLAGMDRARFIAAMREFQSGSRPATVMNRIAKGYNEEELAAMAAFFHHVQSPASSLPPPGAQQDQAQPGPTDEPHGEEEPIHSGQIFPENRP